LSTGDLTSQAGPVIAYVDMVYSKHTLSGIKSLGGRRNLRLVPTLILLRLLVACPVAFPIAAISGDGLPPGLVGGATNDSAPEPVLRLLSTRASGDKLEFVLQGESGRVYAIERSGDLSAWLEVPSLEVSLPSNSVTALVEVPLTNGPNDFLRARLKSASPPEVWDDISVRAELIEATRQDWGFLGLGTSAFELVPPGLPLQIGSQVYPTGLGLHANGAILLLLDGEYDLFESDVGTHPCPAASVDVQVLVDGELRYQSGLMRPGDAPRKIQIPVSGAYEVLLVATDGGDGINCDLTTWGGARLRRAAKPGESIGSEPVDVGPSARVVTWDPNWVQGTLASRTQDFPAQDVFLETDVPADAAGNYIVPVSTNGLACIGLEWFNARALKQLSLGFLSPAAMPSLSQIRVEGWFGWGAWLGDWKELEGTMSLETNRFVFLPSRRTPPGCGPASCSAISTGYGSALLRARKIRWVWPATETPAVVQHPAAFTRSRWAAASIQVEVEDVAGQPDLEARLEDGEWASPVPVPVADSDGELGQALGQRIVAGQPVTMSLRYARPSALKSEFSKLLLRRGDRAVAVAINDVLTNQCVYLRDMGVLLCPAEAPIRVSDYKVQIASRKTILEQVRAMPDQTLGQAMLHTHRSAQNDGPIMLSLTAENDKYVMERSGVVHFQTTTATTSVWGDTASDLVLGFAGDGGQWLSRKLDGSWLPIPVIEHQSGAAILSQRAWVAPIDDDLPDPARFNRRSVCVIDFGVQHTGPTVPLPQVSLAFRPSATDGTNDTLEATSFGFVARNQGRPFAYIVRTGPGVQSPKLSGLTITFAGESLLPGADHWTVYLLPPGGQTDIGPPFPGADTLRTAVETYWRAVLAPAMEIATPDPFLNDLIRSLRIRCLMAARNEAGGDRFAPWIAAMSYGPTYLDYESFAVIRAMDLMGHGDFSRRAIEYLMLRYQPAGYLTTGYTTSGTARHLETVVDHCRLTGDLAWFERNMEAFRGVGHWIIAQTRKTMRTRPTPQGPLPVPGYGLMTPAVVGDNYAYSYVFSVSAYYASALKGIGELLSKAGDSEGEVFQQEGQQLADHTVRAWANMASLAPAVPLRDGTWVPYYPSQVNSPGLSADFAPVTLKLQGFITLQLPAPGIRTFFSIFWGEDGGRTWCYDVETGAHHFVPTGLLAADDPRVTSMMDHMEDVQFLADGWFDYAATDNQRDWFNLGGFSKVQPYYTRNCDVYASLGDSKPFLRSYFNSMATLMNTEVLTFWEHFQRDGAWDKTHEAGQFLGQTRTMLVGERGNTLSLAPLITTNWLADGLSLTVNRAPTSFGQVSYQLTSHVAQGAILAAIDAPASTNLQTVELRIRHPGGLPIRAVTLNGANFSGFDPSTGVVSLPSGSPHMDVQVSYVR